jgi:hypothetical protein
MGGSSARFGRDGKGKDIVLYKDLVTAGNQALKESLREVILPEGLKGVQSCP